VHPPLTTQELKCFTLTSDDELITLKFGFQGTQALTEYISKLYACTSWIQLEEFVFKEKCFHFFISKVFNGENNINGDGFCGYAVLAGLFYNQPLLLNNEHHRTLFREFFDPNNGILSDQLGDAVMDSLCLGQFTESVAMLHQPANITVRERAREMLDALGTADYPVNQKYDGLVKLPQSSGVWMGNNYFTRYSSLIGENSVDLHYHHAAFEGQENGSLKLEYLTGKTAATENDGVSKRYSTVQKFSLHELFSGFNEYGIDGSTKNDIRATMHAAAHYHFINCPDAAFISSFLTSFRLKFLVFLKPFFPNLLCDKLGDNQSPNSTCKIENKQECVIFKIAEDGFCAVNATYHSLFGKPCKDKFSIITCMQNVIDFFADVAIHPTTGLTLHTMLTEYLSQNDIECRGVSFDEATNELIIPDENDTTTDWKQQFLRLSLQNYRDLLGKPKHCYPNGRLYFDVLSTVMDKNIVITRAPPDYLEKTGIHEDNEILNLTDQQYCTIDFSKCALSCHQPFQIEFEGNDHLKCKYITKKKLQGNTAILLLHNAHCDALITVDIEANVFDLVHVPENFKDVDKLTNQNNAYNNDNAGFSLVGIPMVAGEFI